MNEAVLKQYEKAPRTWIVQLGVLFLLIIIFAWSGSTIELSKIPENGLQISQSILQGIVTPETSLLLNFTTKGQAFTSAIIPQILPTYLASSLYCFEGNVRYASILGYVGAGGIGIILNENLGWREYGNVGMILVTLFITVVIIESVSYYLRTKLT